MTIDGRYEQMFFKALRIRLVEERVAEIYPSDRIQSPVHLSIGQEAVAVGVCEALRPSDPLFATYRGHSWYLAKGGSLRAMLAELLGRADGCGSGKAGSMHLVAPEVGFLGCSAIVASTIPHAVGAALAAKRLRTGQVVVAVFGDGATEEGVYHESLNFAALHALPVLFVCENNDLAIHSSRGDRQAYAIEEHARAYGVTTRHCAAGHDPMEVHALAREAVTAIRRDGKPWLVEIDTCRDAAHVGVADESRAAHRDVDAIARWRARDPLRRDTRLVERFTPQILAEIDAAEALAEASPHPSAGDLLEHVL